MLAFAFLDHDLDHVWVLIHQKLFNNVPLFISILSNRYKYKLIPNQNQSNLVTNPSK